MQWTTPQHDRAPSSGETLYTKRLFYHSERHQNQPQEPSEEDKPSEGPDPELVGTAGKGQGVSDTGYLLKPTDDPGLLRWRCHSREPS